ncbi:hydroxymethylglutaryl-CoA lyase [Nemorincola caseinilytica]|uniref:Hydroxymethylglutaryl-CoA lyase n=2 Tax=Nemorincola caseinilytica TaxID=2054315 RepID=A0ABP8NMR6_9BACT
MQGWDRHIPAAEKAEYLNLLLRVGFDVLDFGSFVSAKAIPQLADTKEVLSMLDLSATRSKLLAIIANTRGAEEAVQYSEISYLGFPLSISETFQMRNTNKTIEQSLVQVQEIQDLCVRHSKELVVYISMGFGNPYGDPYNAEVAIQQVGKLVRMGIGTIAMSDTVGVATPHNISYIFNSLLPEFTGTNIGAHFHSTADTWREKVGAAYNAGCRRYDSAIRGIGGCPMAKDDLVGNMATEHLVDWCDEHQLPLQLDKEAFRAAWEMAGRVFRH